MNEFERLPKTERDMKRLIFGRFPESQWRSIGPTRRIGDDDLIGVAILPMACFDASKMIPIDDVELREIARDWLVRNAPARTRSPDEDAILVLVEIQ